MESCMSYPELDRCSWRSAAGRERVDSNRRRIIFASLAAFGSSIAFAGPFQSYGAETITLRKLAAEKRLVYGTAISAAEITGDPEFADLVRHQAAVVVASYDMKWAATNRGKLGDDDYGPADAVAAFALENGLFLRGHNLLWYESTPRWFFDLPTREMESAIVEHIHNLVGRYRGKIHSWDVVNEPIEPEDGRPDGLRTAVFLDKMGPDYLDLAYRTARETDPAARLVINEYGIELDAPEHQARRTALLNLLRRMQGSGTPVDAVGIQAHLSCAGGPPFSAFRLRQFLAEIAALGLTIQITELDVTDKNAPADDEIRDRLVADTYSRFLDAALDEPAVKMVVTWGLSDRHSWIARERRDQLPSRPLPFDAVLEPKLAFEAMARAFTHAPQRRTAE
jgi:endo-1,4-beta-xylanase